MLEAISTKEKLPEKVLLLTFDDGYADNYNVAMPILENYGVQGSFFIPGKTFTTHQLLDVNKIHYVLASANIYNLVEDLERKKWIIIEAKRISICTDGGIVCQVFCGK